MHESGNAPVSRSTTGSGAAVRPEAYKSLEGRPLVFIGVGTLVAILVIVMIVYFIRRA